MAYVTIPKDLTKVKSKVLFGLTKRQLICFGAAALIGVPLFFLLRRTASNSAAAFCMIIVMLPFFLLAMYERHGVLSLGIVKGTNITLIADGSDEKEAVDALVSLIQNNFGE